MQKMYYPHTKSINMYQFECIQKGMPAYLASSFSNPLTTRKLLYSDFFSFLFSEILPQENLSERAIT